MARKARTMQDSSSDDDAPEIVSRSVSKADAKRSQKALRDFEVEEKARRKARNRAKDQRLKERARVTRGGRAGEKLKGVRFTDQGEDEGGSGEDDGKEGGNVEARMLRAMRDAADEAVSSKGERAGDGDDEFGEFGQGMDLDDGMSSGGSDPTDPEAPTDDEEMDEDDEDEGNTPLQTNIHKSNRKPVYLAEELFTAAFASRRSEPPPKKTIESAKQQTDRKRRRKSIAHPKDLVIGGRTIRTLPQLSDPQLQATARSIPSAHARRFVDQSLAFKGEQASIMAKRKGWERRPANVGVMKYQGAPHGFARITR